MECLALRDNTERPETITIGTNELIGADPSKLPPARARFTIDGRAVGKMGDPTAVGWEGGERIVAQVERVLNEL